MAAAPRSNVAQSAIRRAAIPALAVGGAFALALFVHGCATTDPAQEPRASREYRTGSNLPVRDRSSASGATSVDPDAVQDAVRRSMPPTPLGAKGG